MPPLQLLIVTSAFPTATRPDAGVFAARQAALLARQGVDVRVVVPRLLLPKPLRRFSRWPGHSDPELLVPEGVTTRRAFYFRPPGARFTPFEGAAKAPSVVLRAGRWHRQKPFDVVLGIDMTADVVAAVAAAKVLRLPVAGLAIGSDVMLRPAQDARLRTLLEATLARLDLAMGVSRAICECLASTGRCRREPVCVYLGRERAAQLDAGERAAFRAHLSVRAQDVVAVFVGRLTPEKGMPELARACEALLPRHPDLHLVCVGEGPSRGDLEAAFARAGRPGRVHFAGRVAPDAVARYLAAADFLVFPSRSEGMPQAVLEAMERSLPVVATRVGGIPEAVLDGESGLLVPPGDSAALEAAMDRMLSDGEFRSRAATASAARAADVFDSEQNAARMADALRALAKRRPPSS